MIKLYFDKYPIVSACSDFFFFLSQSVARCGAWRSPSSGSEPVGRRGAGCSRPEGLALPGGGDCTERKAQCKMGEVSTLAIKI